MYLHELDNGCLVCSEDGQALAHGDAAVYCEWCGTTWYPPRRLHISPGTVDTTP